MKIDADSASVEFKSTMFFTLADSHAHLISFHSDVLFNDTKSMKCKLSKNQTRKIKNRIFVNIFEIPKM